MVLLEPAAFSKLLPPGAVATFASNVRGLVGGCVSRRSVDGEGGQEAGLTMGISMLAFAPHSPLYS